MRSLIICSTCRYSAEEKLGPEGLSGGELLIAEVRAELQRRQRGDVIVETQACLWNCKRFCSVIFRDDARFTYVTGDHSPTAAQAVAIIDWFDRHGATDTGEVPFRQWPEAMRGHFIARVPKSVQE